MKDLLIYAKHPYNRTLSSFLPSVSSYWSPHQQLLIYRYFWAEIFTLVNLFIILFHFCIDFPYLASFQHSFTLMPDCVLNDREYPDRINSCHLIFNSIEIKACSSLSRYKEKYKHCDKS